MCHSASDCVACHSSLRLLYDQIPVLRDSLVFMESRTDSYAKSIQTDRHHPVAQVATQEGGELGLFAEFDFNLRPNFCCLRAWCFYDIQ